MFSLVPGSPRIGREAEVCVIQSPCPLDPPQVQGQGLLRLLGLLGLQYSGTPGDHPLRPTGELARPRPTRQSSWESAAGWGLASHFPDSFPQGSVLPTDPLTLEASIPRAALGSWGAPEWGVVLRGSWGWGHCLLRDCQHCHLWRKRKRHGMGTRVSPGTGQLKSHSVGSRRPKEPVKPSLAQKFIRRNCGFQIAQFITFIVEKSLYTTTATQVEFCDHCCVG